MANVLGELTYKIGTDTKGLNTGISGAEKKVGKFSGFVKKHAVAIGAAVAAMGVAMVAAVGASIKAWAKAGDEIEKMTYRTGIGAEALSEMKHALEISGTTLTSFEKGVKKMSKTIIDASEGMATYIRTFDRLGIKVEDLMGLKAEEQFFKIAMALAEVTDDATRSATAVDIFGRAGTQLLPMLAQGAEGIQLLREEAHELGLVFDEEAAKKAASLTDTLHRLTEAINGAKYSLAEQFAPSVEGMVMGMTKAVIMVGDFIEQNSLLKNILNTLTFTTQAYHEKVLESGMELQEEYNKAIAGETNEYLKALEAHTKYLKGLIETSLRQEELTKTYGDWISKAESAIEALKQQEKDTRDYNDAIKEQSELLAEAAKAEDELAEAQRRRRLEQFAAMQAFEQHIREGQISIQEARAEEAQRRAERGLPPIEPLPPGGIYEERTAPGYRLPPGSRERSQQWQEEMARQGYPIRVEADVSLDGEKVGEIVMRGGGESTKQREHMAGGTE